MCEKGRALVTYEGEQLSALEKPPPYCNAVIKEVNSIQGSTSLHHLVLGLQSASKFVRIAYNGVAGNTELQIKMREIGFEIAELWDESSLAINKFRASANSIVSDMVGVYEFGREGMEEMVVTLLDSIEETAAEMQKRAKEMECRFNFEKEKLKDECIEIARIEGSKQRDLIELHEKLKDIETQHQKKQERDLQAQQEANRLEKEIEEAICKEQMVVRSLTPNAADIALGMITFGIHPFYRAKKQVRTIQEVQDKIGRLRENKKAAIERHCKAMKELAQHAIKIENCSCETDGLQQSVIALHGAVGALATLRSIMLNVETFWKSLRDTCEQNRKSSRKVSRNHSKDDRWKFYESDYVKRCAVQVYVGWTAIEIVCENYVKHLKAPRRQLDRYLRENPTIDESRRRISTLCHEFHKEIEEGNKEAQRRIKEIDEGDKN